MELNSNIFHNPLDLLLFLFWVDAFEVAVDIQMLVDSQQIKQNIVLWTDTSDLPDVCDILLLLCPADLVILGHHMSSKASDASTCGFQHAGQHRDRRCLSSSIMAEHRKDLTFSHIQR